MTVLGQPQHPAMLLIMGLGTQMIYWDPEFCQQLANTGFYVIRFDNRDVGRSSWLTHHPTPSLCALLTHSLLKKRINTSYNLSDMARDSVALLDHLNIQRAYVVGIYPTRNCYG